MSLFFLGYLARKRGVERGRQEGEEEKDSLAEGDRFIDHDEVDGVEVLMTTEAPGEIGVGIGGGVELLAERAKESEEALGDLGWEMEEVLDDEVDGDVVTEPEEGLPGEAVGHEGLLGQGSLISDKVWLTRSSEMIWRF